MPTHAKLQDCEQFLQKENSLSPNSDGIIKKYLEVSDRGNLDDFLLVIPDKIRNDDYLHSILRYMRAHNQFDWSDHERIFNNVSFTTVERKVTELLAVVAQKDPHAFWYLAHSFEAKQEPLYRHLHGPIQCCVCREIRQKEKDEELQCSGRRNEVFSAFKNALKEKVKKVKGRCSERKDATSSNTVCDTEEGEHAEHSLDEATEPGDKDYTDTEDLESDTPVFSAMKTAMKEAVEEIYLSATAAVKNVAEKGKARKNATRKKSSSREAAHVSYSPDEDEESGDEDYRDAEGSPLKNLPNDKCEPNRVKNDVNTKDWPTVASEQMLTVVTRRKRAYKTAFTALSAVTLFIFHPLPEFAFLFLFIYCNFLIMLITF